MVSGVCNITKRRVVVRITVESEFELSLFQVMGVTSSTCMLECEHAVDEISQTGSWTSRNRQEKLILTLMPVYYINEPLTMEDIAIAKKSWINIFNDRELQESKVVIISEGGYTSKLHMFQDLFYKRLFDVHPFSKTMFKDLTRQGHFLTSMFTFIFDSIGNESKCRRVLEELAANHVQKGVKSNEYGIIGEVIFWTLRKVLRNEYTYRTHTAWVKIFSAMLKIILPVSIDQELRHNSVQLKRISDFEAQSTKTVSTTKIVD